MKTIRLTDEEADAIDCAMGIVLGMAEGAKIVSLKAAMESAREKVRPVTKTTLPECISLEGIPRDVIGMGYIDNPESIQWFRVDGENVTPFKPE